MPNPEIQTESSDVAFNATFLTLGMLAMPTNALIKMMSPEGLIPPVVTNGIYALSALLMVATGFGMSSAHRRMTSLQSAEDAQRPVVIDSVDVPVIKSVAETQTRGY